MVDYPPDNYTQDILEWLQYEIYPGLLQEPWSDRANAVWVSGSRGFLGLWLTGFADNFAPADRLEACRQELYRRIHAVKFPADQPVRTPSEHLPGPIGHRRIVGRLRRGAGRSFVDDAGLILPIFWHFGEAFSAWVRKRADVETQLVDIRDTGYHGIRFWDVLGYYDQSRPGDSNRWVAWAGREVTPVSFLGFSGRTIPATPDYYDQLTAFLTFCRDLGLAVQHDRGDLVAFAPEQVETHAARVDVVQKAVGGNVIAVNAACNEAWQNLPHAWRDDIPRRLKQILDRFGVGALKGSSAADDGYGGEMPSSVRDYTINLGADVHIVHGHRGGESVNRIGHIHALGYETLASKGVLGWQSEPAGPGDGVSVGREEHGEALCLMGAMSLATGQGYVGMSGHGVWWNGPMSAMTAYRELARVPAYLPVDITSFKAIHGGSTWRGQRVFVAHPGHEQPGVFYRADQFVHSDGRFVALIYAGQPGSYRVPVERSFEAEIITPMTGERFPFSGSAGDVRSIDFERGRIIVGRIL